jgi:hypothetical protein
MNQVYDGHPSRGWLETVDSFGVQPSRLGRFKSDKLKIELLTFEIGRERVLVDRAVTPF